MTAVRRDCAFCHYERAGNDDNHAPTCSYWHLFGDRNEPGPCWRCTGSPDPRTLRTRSDGFRKDPEGTQ